MPGAYGAGSVSRIVRRNGVVPQLRFNVFTFESEQGSLCFAAREETMTPKIPPASGSVALKLIECMLPNRSSEFAQLVNIITNDESVREATKRDLLAIAQRDSGNVKLKAVDLLGAFRVKEAEPVLNAILLTSFPEEVLLSMAAERTKTSFRHTLLVKLLIALMLINPEQWVDASETIASRFDGSWLKESLSDVRIEVQRRRSR
jgi:hypothetical protein